jgi:CRISPR-associated exonuclease Cas4
MSDSILIDVTDIKQYVCCPRLVYYRYCLPHVRPLTYSMEVGIQAHQQEEEREVRRGLKTYGIEQGERLFHYPVASESLEVKGKIDLVLVVPSWEASDKEVVVVEYKYSEQKAGPHFKVQLAAYALLLEEALHIPARRAFLYSIPLRRAEAVPITTGLRRKAQEITRDIKQLMQGEQMPAATRTPRRCPTCEFRRFCNDVV